MVLGDSRRVIAKTNFVVEASKQKVWDLLAPVIFQQLPLEQVDITGLDTFKAILRWRLGFLSLPFYVKGKMVDVFDPDSLGCVLSVKRGPIRMRVKVGISLQTTDGNRVEIKCIAFQEGKKTIIGWGLRKQQRSLAMNLFNSIGVRLQEICS